MLLWSIDSDVGAMCPRFCLLLDIKEFYFETGVGKAKRYIPKHEVVEVLFRNTSMILPLIHAFSECDSTSAFSGMGKERWVEVATPQEELLDGLEILGNSITHLSKKTRDALWHWFH